MKIAYCSDLHLGFGDLNCDLPEADVLVLAGDILDGLYHKHYDAFFDKISNHYQHVLYVMGNHEHYGSDFNETLKQLLTNLYKWSNIHMLENESVTISPSDNSGDVKFIGSTLWTNLSDPIHSITAQTGMSDYRYIKYCGKRLNPSATTEHHLQSVEYIKDQLHVDDEKVVIITHHAPCELSVPPRFKDNDLSCAYYTDLTELILDNAQIKLWVHGHIHDPVNYKIGSTKVVSNPRGYDGVENTEGFTIKVIEC